MKAACKLVRGCYTSLLRGGVEEGDGRAVRRSLNERERKKKDGNRGNAEAACGAGGMTESGVAPLRDAAAGKSEVTAVAVVGRRNDAGGEVHQKPDFN